MKPGSIRNKLMLAGALTAAAVLATPSAMAHDYYRGHRDDSGKVLGALVVGAVIGGVIASASQHHQDYYSGGYYAPAPQAYAPAGYYDGGYASYPVYNGGYYGYPSYGYGSGVNVGVVYSSGGSYRSHYGYHSNRGSRYYGGSYGYRGGDREYRHGGQGRYYSRHGH